MRKSTALLGAVAMLSIVPATPVLAQVVDTHEGICYMIVPDANGELTGASVQGTLFIRTNNSWTTMTCHFDLAPNEAPSKTTHARGDDCTYPGFATLMDWRATANPGGNMVLTCRAKN